MPDTRYLANHSPRATGLPRVTAVGTPRGPSNAMAHVQASAGAPQHIQNKVGAARAAAGIQPRRNADSSVLVFDRSGQIVAQHGAPSPSGVPMVGAGAGRVAQPMTLPGVPGGVTLAARQSDTKVEILSGPASPRPGAQRPTVQVFQPPSAAPAPALGGELDVDCCMLIAHTLEKFHQGAAKAGDEANVALANRALGAIFSILNRASTAQPQPGVAEADAYYAQVQAHQVQPAPAPAPLPPSPPVTRVISQARQTIVIPAPAPAMPDFGLATVAAAPINLTVPMSAPVREESREERRQRLEAEMAQLDAEDAADHHGDPSSAPGQA